ITGENGSGKTTIAKILSGNITTEENTIKINGIQQEKANSPFVGSSKIIKSTFFPDVRDTPNFCFCPPDKLCP
ncbi:ATP-binding cassette domain-containing protein, partial [Escherichia coli]|uniref:ATP-binding cassette domain-containing protein n=1 Tax=Escherichia coli TaxID=562 RepID=UPI003EE1D15A